MWKKKLEVDSRIRDDQTRIYTLAGCLFGSTEGYGFQEEVRKEIASGVKKIVIDLSEVSYVDSASIGCLMDIYRMVSDRSGALKLVGLQERVETMVSLTGLHNLVEIFREERGALESF